MDKLKSEKRSGKNVAGRHGRALSAAADGVHRGSQRPGDPAEKGRRHRGSRARQGADQTVRAGVGGEPALSHSTASSSIGCWTRANGFATRRRRSWPESPPTSAGRSKPDAPPSPSCPGTRRRILTEAGSAAAPDTMRRVTTTLEALSTYAAHPRHAAAGTPHRRCAAARIRGAGGAGAARRSVRPRRRANADHPLRTQQNRGRPQRRDPGPWTTRRRARRSAKHRSPPPRLRFRTRNARFATRAKRHKGRRGIEEGCHYRKRSRSP